MKKSKKLVAAAAAVACAVVFSPLVFAAQPVSPENFVFDINGDGKISLADLVAVATHVGRATGDAEFSAQQDCNGDGKITLEDARIMAAAVLGRYSIPEVEQLADYASPSAIAADPNSNALYVVESTAGRIVCIDSVTNKRTAEYAVEGTPNGVALSPDGTKLYVTYDGANSGVRVLSLGMEEGQLGELWPTGHTPMSPQLSPDGTVLYVANRFDGTVTALDAATGAVLAETSVGREPVSLALSPDGASLYVGCHAAEQAATADHVGAKVRVVNTADMTVRSEIDLCNGATGLRQIALSPDGQYLYATHLLARYNYTTTQLDKGWMNSNVISIIETSNDSYLTTVQLDDMTKGAANPWAITCTPDGSTLAVTSAGSHELILIDRQAMHDKIEDVRSGRLPRRDSDGQVISTDLILADGMEDIPNAVGFLSECRQRIQLPGNGPRAVVCKDEKAFVAGYFSDTLDVVNLNNQTVSTQIQLSSKPIEENAIRLGEMRFNDADICFETYQSCASCHPDGRADSVNWDNLNDGIGNPKNTKSMLYTHYTAPTMITGIRADAEVAVRAGMKYIQFYGGADGEEIAGQIDEYLKAMQPVESPYLVDGKLSSAAQAGKELYDRSCASCHPTEEGKFTQDGKLHTATHIPGDKLELVTQTEKGAQLGKLNTPTLNECWRTAPYLYDGRATTIQELLDIHYGEDLTEEQKQQLAEYVLTL